MTRPKDLAYLAIGGVLSLGLVAGGYIAGGYDRAQEVRELRSEAHAEPRPMTDAWFLQWCAEDEALGMFPEDTLNATCKNYEDFPQERASLPAVCQVGVVAAMLPILDEISAINTDRVAVRPDYKRAAVDFMADVLWECVYGGVY